jgi:uncharacterized protein (TIGR03435 family)
MSLHKSLATLVAFATPLVFSVLTATSVRAQSHAENAAGLAPAYVVTSLEPSRPGSGTVRFFFTPEGVSATGVTLQSLIQEAYGVGDHQISEAPEWVKSEQYDIKATVDKPVADELAKLSEYQRKVATQHMLQALLEDRFKLVLQRGTKDLPVYALVIAKNGPKLQESKSGETYPTGFVGPDRGGTGMMRITMDGEIGRLAGQGVSVASMAHALSQRLGCNVLDETGLRGNYDFTLQWPTTEGLSLAVNRTEDCQRRVEGSLSPGPSIFTAIQEQLGLKLEAQTAPTETLAIEHVEMPSEK